MRLKNLLFKKKTQRKKYLFKNKQKLMLFNLATFIKNLKKVTFDSSAALQPLQ